MKKILVLLASVALFASCAAPRVVPRSVNTINTTALGDLNLQRGDYEVLNTITAEAAIVSIQKNKETRVYEQNNEFSLGIAMDKKARELGFGSDGIQFQGIVKLGYLEGDYNAVTAYMLMRSPEELARRLAIYRVINMAKEQGADAVVEPTIATNIEQVGKNEVVYKTTVTAKIIKLKTDR